MAREVTDLRAEPITIIVLTQYGIYVLHTYENRNISFIFALDRDYYRDPQLVKCRN